MIGLTPAQLRVAYAERIVKQQAELHRLTAIEPPTETHTQAVALLHRLIASSQKQRMQVRNTQEKQQ